MRAPQTSLAGAVDRAHRALLARGVPVPADLALPGLGRVMPLVAAPLGLALTEALRQLARRRPEVFERLGAARRASILICPAGLPVAFLLQPDGEAGRIRPVDAAHPPVSDARIEAPLQTLLALLDGREDGDAAFFSSALWIDGDTAVVLALRNALEDAEMSLTDLLPRPPLPGPWRVHSRGHRS